MMLFTAIPFCSLAGCPRVAITNRWAGRGALWGTFTPPRAESVRNRKRGARYRGMGLAALLALSGCGSVLTESTSTVAGVAGAATGAAITKNATVAAAIGLGVNALADEALRYAERRVHKIEQDNIARVAGALPMGAVATWSVRHDVPIEPDEGGELVVSREFGALGFRCKEIVFSVDERTKRHGLVRSFYTANVCQDGPAWRWASAEPATSRWGVLQ